MIILSSSDVEIIKESFIQLSKDSKNVFDHFYENFFSLDSSARTLFKEVDLTKQKKMLFESLSYFVISNEITDSDLLEYSVSLKEKHQSVNMTKSQIDNFGKALLKTIKESQGESFTFEKEQIWSKLINQILTTF